MITTILTREKLTNIVVTFIEGFVASLVLFETELTQDVIVGAVMAGLSAVWNLILKPGIAKWKSR